MLMWATCLRVINCCIYVCYAVYVSLDLCWSVIYSMESRLVPKKPVQFIPGVISDASTLSSISVFRKIFESSLGPRGNCKIIHNNTGGHATVTSSAMRLLQCTQISSPVLQLISSAVELHLKSFASCGTMAATLSLLLIEKTLVERFKVYEFFELAAFESNQYLLSAMCPVKKSVSFDSLNDLLRLVNGVVSSKTACFLSSAEVAHISHCLVKGFIYSFPVVSEETQVSVSRDCQQQRPSAAAGNLRQPRTVGCQKLLSSCELEVVSQSCDCDIAPSASCQSSSDGTGWLEIEDINIITVPGSSVLASYVTEGLVVEAHFTMNLPNGGLLAAFSCSMAGDSCDTAVSTDELDIDCMLDVDRLVVDKIIVTVNSLVDTHNVKIIICQKVLHPRVKRHLRNRNVVVMDRVGAANTNKLARLTGATLIGSQFSPVSYEQLGHVASLSHILINNKNYLCFRAHRRTVSSFILCCPSDEAASELKLVCDCAFRVLKDSIISRQALIGGGVWQRHLACYLRQSISAKMREFGDRLECDSHQILLGVECVASCLDRIASIIGDTYSESDIDFQSQVLDLASHAVNALQTAMNIAQFALGIGHYVMDSQ